jgi:hypothetical protein
MQNGKLKLSESLEESFEAVRCLNSELSNLKKENYNIRNKNATISRSLEGKYEESNGNLNNPNMLEEKILEIKQLSLKSNDTNRAQLHEDDA